MQTPADVIDAYMAVSRGERVVNATNFTDTPSYSMGPMLDSAQLEGYLNYHEINGVRASEASADLQKTYSISKTDARQYTLPLEDAKRGSGDVVRNENTVEKQADVVGLAQEAFKSNTPEAWSKALEAGGGKVSSIIENLVKNPGALFMGGRMAESQNSRAMPVEEC